MQAYSIEEIVPRMDVKITSAAVHGPSDGKTVILGTDEGKLMTYNVQWDAKAKKFNFRLEHIKAVGHGKKPITNLTLFGDVGLLFSLCDGYLDVWNPLSLEPGPVLPQNRGVTSFCVYRGPDPNFEVAVAQKKKLFLFEYTGRFSLLKELNLPEQPQDMLWWHDTLFFAWKNQYHAIDVVSGAPTMIGTFETEPMLHLALRKFLLIKQEKKGLMYNIGKVDQGTKMDECLSTPVATLQWSSVPREICTQFPYILSAQREEIEIHSVLTWHLQQTISSSHGFRFLVEASDQWILAASKHAIHALVLVPFHVQAEQLVRAGYADDGIALLKATCTNRPDFDSVMKSLLELAGFMRLSKLDYIRAFNLFSRAEYNPHNVIAGIFPYLLATPPTGPDGDNHIKTLIARVAASKGLDAAIDPAKSLTEAELSLMEYLEGSKKTKWGKDRPGLQEINVALFKLYIKSSDPAKRISPFLDTVPDDSLPFPLLESHCLTGGHFYALGCLYKKHRFPRKALDMWRKLGLGELKDGNLDGVAETVKLLSESSDIELISEFAPWIFKKDKTRFMDIFTSTARTEPLPLAAVTNFLNDYGRPLQEAYLEWLVLERKVSDDKAESALAWHYLDTVLGLVQPKDATQAPNAANSTQISSSRAKLLNFLQSHFNYNPHPLLARIQPLPLWNEKIVLHQRTGQHMKALQIMVEDLRDFVRAEEYCLKNGGTPKTSKSASTNAYLSEQATGNPLLPILLKLVLDANPTEALPKQALDLLNRHPRLFNPAEAIALLRPDAPLNLLQPFLEASLRNNLNTARHCSVTKNLEKSFNLSMKAHHYKRTTRSILVTPEVLCPICKKPIGDKVFAYYPDGCVIHYKCYQILPPDTAKHVSPLTGRNFLYDPL
eukprot:TRINITY_DN7219_c0_g1_i1.p1 TRINITY_DN7219_c0_g1~~TRINITY_DN7219_c0_g1_i1.p1  ORF type:complete len:889 (+),score=142.27 TRINITY_DN7219_c0_g1_i1:40-2706(+)